MSVHAVTSITIKLDGRVNIIRNLGRDLEANVIM